MARFVDTPRKISRPGSEIGKLPRVADRSRKDRATADEGETLLSGIFLWSGRLLTFAMILMGPWWFGSVAQLPQLVLYCLAITSMTMLWFSLAFGKRTSHHFPFLAIPVVLGLFLLTFQTLPLPDWLAGLVAPGQSGLYTALASPAPNELLVDKGNATSVVRVTMDLDGTRQAVNLLMLGLLSLLLGSYFFAARKASLLLPAVATINGVALSIYGIVQKLKFGRLIYGTIKLPDGGQPFGPFVNQNNAAGYLLICLACSLGLLYMAFHRRPKSGARPRTIITNDYPVWEKGRLHIGLFFAELNAIKLAALLATAIITLGVFASISRGGLFGLVCGAVVATVYYSMTRRTFSVFFAGAAVVAIAVSGLTWLGFGEEVWKSVARVSDTDFVSNEVRFRHWQETAPAILDFSPLGSGAGSYDDVHRLYRTGSEEKIFYFAENQYYQSLVETGWPGLVFLVAALVILALCIRFLAVRGNSPKTGALSLVGVFLIVSQSVVAIFDFGLFIPSNMVAMALVCGMLAGQAHSLADRLRKRYYFRFNFPLSLNMLMLLLAFSAGLYCAMDALRYTRIELALGPLPAGEDYQTTNLDEVDGRLQRLQTALQGNADAEAWTRLGELYVLRYRLALYETLARSLAREQADDPESMRRIWLSTGLERLQALIGDARRSGDASRLRQLREDPLVTDNLIPAIHYLKLSRARNPVQATVHLMLAQLHVISPVANADQPHLDRARETAPANAVAWLISGLMDLQASRLDDAVAHLKQCLKIDPSRYALVARIAATTLPMERIVQEVLPDEAFILFDFARNYLVVQSLQSLQIDTLRRAEVLLQAEGSDDRKSLLILSEILIALDKREAAVETLALAADSNRDVQQIRIKLVNLLVDLGRYDEALVHLRRVRKFGNDHRGLEALQRKIEKLRLEHGPSR